MDIYVVLNMLGDKNRLRIVNILYNNMLSVNEIKEVLSLSQPNTSKHLKKLLESNMVLKHQVNNTVYNYLNPMYVKDCMVLNPVINSFRTKEDSINDLNKLENILTDVDIKKRRDLI